MGLVEFFGFLGAIKLALCGAPQLYKAVKEKHQRGMHWGTIYFWLSGEVFTILYLLFTPTPLNFSEAVVMGIMTYPLLVNYGANMIFLSGILWYKLFPTDGGPTSIDDFKKWWKERNG
jgi:hypothetical protein